MEWIINIEHLNIIIRVHGQVFTFYKFIWCHQNTVFWLAMLIYIVKCLGIKNFSKHISATTLKTCLKAKHA